MNRLKGELSAGNKRKHKRNKNKRWKLRTTPKKTNYRLELLETWKWRWKEEGT